MTPLFDYAGLDLDGRKTTDAECGAAGPEDWTGWKPDWTPGADTPHRRQEAHSASENVTLRNGNTKEKHDSRRRITDARLWDAMSGAQQDAALNIAFAFETMGKGLGYVTSNWERIPGSSGPGTAADMHARLIHGYVEWTKLCAREKVSHSMIIDILVFGFSCRALDQDRRTARGFSRQNLLAGLSLYCKMKGWPDD